MRPLEKSSAGEHRVEQEICRREAAACLLFFEALCLEFGFGFLYYFATYCVSTSDVPLHSEPAQIAAFEPLDLHNVYYQTHFSPFRIGSKLLLCQWAHAVRRKWVVLNVYLNSPSRYTLFF